MVRSSERPVPDEGSIGRQQVGHAVDLGYFQRFFDGHPRQYPWQRLGDEGFSGPRWASKKGVVDENQELLHSIQIWVANARLKIKWEMN
jgi:hypothetical protein